MTTLLWYFVFFITNRIEPRRSSTSFPSYSLTKTSPVDNTGFIGARGIISFRERYFHTSRGKAVNTGKNNIIYHRNHCLTGVILGLIFVFFFIHLYMLVCWVFFFSNNGWVTFKSRKKKKHIERNPWYNTTWFTIHLTSSWLSYIPFSVVKWILTYHWLWVLIWLVCHLVSVSHM